MICCPTFTTSITLISAASEVVLTIRVNRLMAPGSTRRSACGASTYRNTCARVSPRASADVR